MSASILDFAKLQKLSTLVAVFTLDRLGRRKSLYYGSIVMGISMFLSGGLSKAAQVHPAKASAYGAAAASFTFLFTVGFGATWLTIPWLYPAEIFPLQVRAKGNAWGVVGWSIGNGWTVSITHNKRLRDRSLIHVAGPALADHVPEDPRKDFLCLRCLQYPHSPHNLGILSGIQSAHT